MGGAMGSSSNEKKTKISNINQAADASFGGQLAQIFIGGKKNPFKGNITLTGPTDQSQTTTIEKTGAAVSTVSGSSDSATGAATTSISPHLFGLTWTQWAMLGVAVLGLYWFFKRKKG